MDLSQIRTVGVTQIFHILIAFIRRFDDFDWILYTNRMWALIPTRLKGNGMIFGQKMCHLEGEDQQSPVYANTRNAMYYAGSWVGFFFDTRVARQWWFNVPHQIRLFGGCFDVSSLVMAKRVDKSPFVLSQVSHSVMWKTAHPRVIIESVMQTMGGRFARMGVTSDNYGVLNVRYLPVNHPFVHYSLDGTAIRNVDIKYDDQGNRYFTYYKISAYTTVIGDFREVPPYDEYGPTSGYSFTPLKAFGKSAKGHVRFLRSFSSFDDVVKWCMMDGVGMSLHGTTATSNDVLQELSALGDAAKNYLFYSDGDYDVSRLSPPGLSVYFGTDDILFNDIKDIRERGIFRLLERSGDEFWVLAKRGRTDMCVLYDDDKIIGYNGFRNL